MAPPQTVPVIGDEKQTTEKCLVTTTIGLDPGTSVIPDRFRCQIGREDHDEQILSLLNNRNSLMQMDIGRIIRKDTFLLESCCR